MFKKYCKIAVMAVIAVLITGCAVTSGDYKLGDISKQYCASSNVESRNLVKNILLNSGVIIGVDYCAIHGLVDMMSVTTNDAVVQNQNFERQ